MKTTGSPTKRNREKAIRPTTSITAMACPSRLRTNASIKSLESGCVEIRKRPGEMAEAARPPRPPVAGHARPLPHLALGGDAPADPGERRHSVLQALPAPLPHDRGARWRLRRRGAPALERSRLLRSRQKPACRGEDCFTIRLVS